MRSLDSGYYIRRCSVPCQDLVQTLITSAISLGLFFHCHEEWMQITVAMMKWYPYQMSVSQSVDHFFHNRNESFEFVMCYEYARRHDKNMFSYFMIWQDWYFSKISSSIFLLIKNCILKISLPFHIVLLSIPSKLLEMSSPSQFIPTVIYGKNIMHPSSLSLYTSNDLLPLSKLMFLIEFKTSAESPISSAFL